MSLHNGAGTSLWWRRYVAMVTRRDPVVDNGDATWPCYREWWRDCDAATAELGAAVDHAGPVPTGAGPRGADGPGPHGGCPP